MARLFFYGSLRDPEMVSIVLGRRLGQRSLLAARAVGFATRRLGGEAYPLLVPVAGAEAEGVVLTDASPEDLRRLEFFEEAEYGLAPISVVTAEGSVEAQFFRATEKTPATSLPWDYASWCAHDRTVAIEAAIELMQFYGRLPVADIDTVWPAI
ncbi:MAG: gamma-glutamylcyclotransferase family protein, partial [Pseudomonadota bacterium]